MDNRQIRVLVVDEFPLFRKGISEVISASPDFQLLGAAADANTALSLLSLKPDLLVLDLDAQSFSPIELLTEVKYRLPTCRTLMMLCKAESSPELMQSIRLDANGFILRTISPEDLLEQLRLVHAGGMAASEKITAALADHLRTKVQKKPAKDPSITQLLTNREYEVLCCVASGLSNREIAEVLKITDGTVKVHVKHLLKKLKFRSRVEAAIWASEHDFRLSDEQLAQYGFDHPSAALTPAATE